MLKREKDEYGRLIPKPAAPVDEHYFDEHLYDAVPVQEQIDTITVKLQLKGHLSLTSS